VVMQGSNEKERPGGPFVIVKDLAFGSRVSDDTSDRDEHLRRQSQAQLEVPESELVNAVLHILIRNKLVRLRTPPPPPPLS
jgi:hypothetical protein